MKALATLAALVALSLVGCGPTQSGNVAKTVPQITRTGVTVGDYELGAPISSDNVTVVPVMYKNPPQQQGNEITLAEAKKLGLVEIIEIPGAEEVNRLRVHNKSDRPLLLIGGELLLGGKQDRIVIHDVIIPPGKTEDVDVDCVEHGRWQGISEHFDYSGQIVPSVVREQAAYGDQEGVWSNVAGFNAKASPATAGRGGETTLQVGLNSPDVEKHVQGALPNLSKALTGNSRVIGVIYVLNGQIKSMDLFGNPRVFSQTVDGLLHGYLAEGAVTTGNIGKSPSTDDYKRFVADMLASKRDRTSRGEDVYFLSTPSMNGNEVDLPADGKAAGGLIHGSYSRK